MNSTVTYPDKEETIATIKTIAEEIWNRMEGTVEILVTSLKPLRTLITRPGEILASIRHSTQATGILTDWYPSLLYLVVVREELPPIAQCRTWMVKEVYRHFLRETMAIHMLLLPPPSAERRRIFMDSDEN
jgi:hypothetical protein